MDDAIIDIENVVRRLRQHRKEGGSKSTGAGHPRGIARGAARDRLRHADRSVALLPVFFMGGLSGAFFQPLAMSYSLSLLASMVVALTVTPALACILLSQAPLERESPFVLLAADAVHAGCWARRQPKPRPAYVASLLSGGRAWCGRASGSRCCPTSRSAIS